MFFMKGVVFNECICKGDCSLKLNMGENVAIIDYVVVLVTFPQ